MALNWYISKPQVIVIPKADSIEHTLDNCHASGWRLSPEHVRLLEGSMKSPRRIVAALRGAARLMLQRPYRPAAISRTT